MNWSGTTRWPGAISSRRLPTAPTAMTRVDAEVLQGPEVGAERQLRRQEAMAAAVARQEEELGGAEAAVHDRVGRRRRTACRP